MRQDHHHSVNNMGDHIYPIGNQIEQVKSFKRFYYQIHKIVEDETSEGKRS